MSLVDSTEISHTTHPYFAALRNVDNAEANLAQAQRAVDRGREDTEELAARLTFFRHVFGDTTQDRLDAVHRLWELTRGPLSPPSWQLAPETAVEEHRYLANMINDRVGDWLYNRHEDSLSIAREYRDAIRWRESELSDYRRRLALIPMPESRTVTLEEAKAALQGFPIKHVRLYEYAAGNTTLRFTVFDQIMRLSGANAARNIHPGKPPAIKLPPISVAINFSTGKVHLTPYTPARLHHGTGMSGHHQAHPHITSILAEPCFGDFGGAISEAITKVDITTTAALLLMFLQQADTNDTAGKHAISWAWPDGAPTATEGYLVLTDDNGNVTIGRHTGRTTASNFTITEQPATRDIDTYGDLWPAEDAYINDQIYNHILSSMPDGDDFGEHARPPLVRPIVDPNETLTAPPAEITVNADYGDDGIAIEPPHEVW